MNSKPDINDEKKITVSINGKETNSFLLEDAIKRKWNVKDIVIKEIDKSPEIKAVAEFFVHVNGKRVKPKDVRNIRIENVQIIEIFDGVQMNPIPK